MLLGVGGVLLAAGGLVGAVRTGGYDLGPAHPGALRSLSAWQFVVVQALARRIAAADDPNDESIPSADAVDVAGFVDAYVAEMHPLMRRDLVRLLSFIEHLAPLGVRAASRFTKLDGATQDAVLSWLESNDQGLLRGGFAAVKSLVFMGYYRDPRTWKILGYAGPLVGRPVGGWQ